MKMNLCVHFYCFVDDDALGVFWDNVNEGDNQRCWVNSTKEGTILPLNAKTMKEVVLETERNSNRFSRFLFSVDNIAVPKETEEWFEKRIDAEEFITCRSYYCMVVNDHINQVTEKYTMPFFLDYLETVAENPGIVDMIFRATIEGCMVPDGEGGEFFDEDLFNKYVGE